MIQFNKLDHVQICIPIGKEKEARAFYTDILGWQEIPKPKALLKNGGLWYQLEDIQIHIGTEDNFYTSKRHPSFLVKNILQAKKHLIANGVRIKENTPIPRMARFDFFDPFNNRIELMEKYPENHSHTQAYWNDFIRQHPQYQDHSIPEDYYFCNREKDANTCSDLVVQGIKTGTCGALIQYQIEQEAPPQTGSLWIITDWDKRPTSLIKITSVITKKFKDIGEEWAKKEGEGDRSLAYWREGHWDFFVRELAQYGLSPTEDLELVCEEFERVY